MEETKREKFVRLAENRVNNALKQIELISNLSNSRVYDYTKSDVDRILKALKSAVNELEVNFKPEKKNRKFSLNS